MNAAAIARRLAQLEGVPLSAEDLDSITREFEELDGALAELERFAGDVDWQWAWPDRPAQRG